MRVCREGTVALERQENAIVNEKSMVALESGANMKWRVDNRNQKRVIEMVAFEEEWKRLET